MNNTNHYSPDDKDNRMQNMEDREDMPPLPASWRTWAASLCHSTTLPRRVGRLAA